MLAPFRDAVERLITIPGVSRMAAEAILAEIGPDMTSFPTAGHLLSWAGLVPRLDESAGKRRSTRVRKGAPWLKPVLVQCAWAAGRTKATYYQAQFFPLKARRGPKKAAIAVAAALLTAAYHMLKDGTFRLPFEERAMRARTFVVRLVLTAALLGGAIGTARPASAQSSDDLVALSRRVVGLINAARLDEAMPLARQSITLARAQYGEDHPEYALALNNMAELLRGTNRLAEAEPLYRRVLAINEKSLGPEHPIVASGLNPLAGLVRATNRLAEAEPLYRRALTITETSYGPDHTSVASILNNLALLLTDTTSANAWASS